MADSIQDIITTYPLVSYRFRVDVDNEQAEFNNVSGLDMSFDSIEYKEGSGTTFRMPGQQQTPNITLSKGKFPGENKLFEWINSISLNRVIKKDITISLIDETGTERLVTWIVSGAFPTQLTGPSLDATSNEIAVEQITLVADRISLQTQ